MRLRYRIPLAIIAICMVITMFVASSYALWSVTITQESKNAIESGCFAITFDDTDSTSIHLENAYPMTDEKGLKTVPYTFTIKNTCTVDAKFTLYLNSLEVENKLSDEWIKYSLLEDGGAVAVPASLINAEKNPDTSYFTFKKDFGKDVFKSYVLATGELKGRSADDVDDGDSMTYHLRLWIDESAQNTKKDNEGNILVQGIEGQTFEAGVSTVAYATKLKTENIVDTPSETN